MTTPRLEQTDRGLTVIAAGRYMYSRHNPSQRPEASARRMEARDQCLYVVPSPLLGYGLNILLERVPDSSHVLALEVSPELMELCAESIPAELKNHPRISWLSVSDNKGLYAFLSRLGLWRFRRILRADLSAGASLNEPLYTELLNFMSSLLASYWRNRNTLIRMGRAWIRHVYANLAALSADTLGHQLELLPSGHPVVVAGAGPSLEAALPFLHRNQAGLHILAADTAAGALWKAGIRPDAIVVLETQAWNMLDFHGLAESRIPVIADLSAYPPSLRAAGGSWHVFSSEFAPLRFLHNLRQAGLREYSLPPLGSVGVAAVEIGLSVTSGPVLLCGLDFAYTPGKTHARGTAVHQWQLSTSNRLRPCSTWHPAGAASSVTAAAAAGGSIHSDKVLFSYARLFKDRYAQEQRLRILEPGGVDLGIPLISFEQAQTMLAGRTDIRKPEFILPPSASAPASAPAPASPAARGFLESELKAMDNIIEAWELYAAGKTEAGTVAAALDGMDQIFADFPDTPRRLQTDNAFLVRAVSRARRLQRYILRQLGPGA